MIQYYSTRGNAPLVSFQEALFRGLAPDGGLYFPNNFPRYTKEELVALHGASLSDVAYSVMSKWFADEIDRAALQTIAEQAQHFPIPLRSVGDRRVLEIFHGPTLAFKDVAAQNLPRLMSYFLQRDTQKITLLVATSGDTGGAIAHGFSNVPNIDVYVLFPKGRVSTLQEEQLTRVADNVHPIEVDGFFDDCQAMVKRAFNDESLTALNLTSANSISIGRLIPQIIYYVYTYAALRRDDIQFVVPSGNFGNLTAGLFAREMGLPFNHFVAATNMNDAAVRYINSGAYEPVQTIPTLSNAMDVGAPSNFVRVLEIFGREYQLVRDVLSAYSLTDADTVATMKRVWEEYAYLLDPHTAVGWEISDRVADPSLTQVLIATASPIKFAAEITHETGISVDNSAEIASLQQRPQRKKTIPNSYDALVDLLTTAV